jgi:hypothetical protein
MNLLSLLQVPGIFYVNDKLERLMFDELRYGSKVYAPL